MSTTAKIVDLDIDTVNKILHAESVDLPLYLLDADVGRGTMVENGQ